MFAAASALSVTAHVA